MSDSDGGSFAPSARIGPITVEERRKIQEMLAVRKPVLFDCRVDPAENCYPMIPSGGAHNEMLLSPDDGGEISDAGKMLV